MTVIRFAKPQPRVALMESEGAFSHAMQQSADIRRNGRGDVRQIVEVWFQVAGAKRKWQDVELFWRGPWQEGGVPTPTLQDVIDIGRKYGARYAQANVRSIV